MQYRVCLVEWRPDWCRTQGRTSWPLNALIPFSYIHVGGWREGPDPPPEQVQPHLAVLPEEGVHISLLHQSAGPARLLFLYGGKGFTWLVWWQHNPSIVWGFLKCFYQFWLYLNLSSAKSRSCGRASPEYFSARLYFENTGEAPCKNPVTPLFNPVTPLLHLCNTPVTLL